MCSSSRKAAEPVLRLVDARALEHRRAVVEDVRERVDLRVREVHEPAVHPDLLDVLVGHRVTSEGIRNAKRTRVSILPPRSGVNHTEVPDGDSPRLHAPPAGARAPRPRRSPRAASRRAAERPTIRATSPRRALREPTRLPARSRSPRASDASAAGNGAPDASSRRRVGAVSAASACDAAIGPTISRPRGRARLLRGRARDALEAAGQPRRPPETPASAPPRTSTSRVAPSSVAFSAIQASRSSAHRRDEQRDRRRRRSRRANRARPRLRSRPSRSASPAPRPRRPSRPRERPRLPPSRDAHGRAPPRRAGGAPWPRPPADRSTTKRGTGRGSSRRLRDNGRRGGGGGRARGRPLALSRSIGIPDRTSRPPRSTRAASAGRIGRNSSGSMLATTSGNRPDAACGRPDEETRRAIRTGGAARSRAPRRPRRRPCRSPRRLPRAERRRREGEDARAGPRVEDARLRANLVLQGEQRQARRLVRLPSRRPATRGFGARCGPRAAVRRRARPDRSRSRRPTRNGRDAARNASRGSSSATSVVERGAEPARARPRLPPRAPPRPCESRRRGCALPRANPSGPWRASRPTIASSFALPETSEAGVLGRQGQLSGFSRQLLGSGADRPDRADSYLKIFFAFPSTPLPPTGAPVSSAYSRSSSFSFADGDSGIRTPVRTTRSPRPRRPSRPNPFPRSRISDPAGVPAAIGDLLRALERRDLDLAAEHERRVRQVEAQDDVVPLALEDLVLGHGQDDVEIPRRTAGRPRVAFAGEAQARSGLDACRNADLELPSSRAGVPRRGSPRTGDRCTRPSPRQVAQGRVTERNPCEKRWRPRPAASRTGPRPGARPRRRSRSRSRTARAARPRAAPPFRRPLRGTRSRRGRRGRCPPSDGNRPAAEAEELAEEIREVGEDRRVESAAARERLPATRPRGRTDRSGRASRDPTERRRPPRPP